MNSQGNDRARDLLARYLTQLRDSGETEIYVAQDVAAALKSGLAQRAAVAAPVAAVVAASPKATVAAPVATSAPAPVKPAAPPKAVAPEKATAPQPDVIVVECLFGAKKTAPDMFSEASPLERCTTLEDVEKLASACTKCELARTRTKVVFGVGNPRSRLMFIGEAPGHDEDLQGIPFVGRAGQLLDKILEAAGIARDDVYIGNIIKCRPPNNRTPMTSEIDACSPYLVKQLELIKPKVVCTLGLPATMTLLGLKGAMGSMRGKIYQYGDIKLIPTYHPAAALRDPRYKRPLWDDFLIVKREYERV
jgi:uracil-DNA glycosylase family 4